MKKGLIITTTLAMVLGVGVAVGAHQAKASKVEAAGETTIYLDTNKLTWYGDQSRAYLYGSGGNNGWPGKALTHVEGSIYKLDVANMSNYQNVIFLRSNGTDVWNRTSRDGGTAINLPTNWSTQNMWKFNDNWDGNEYGDGNYTGTWSKYTPAPAPEVEYNVTCVVDGVAETPIKVGEGLLPAAKGNKYAQSFDGWYTASDYKTKITAITADCSVYGRFVDKATATYTIDDGYAKKFDSYSVYAWNSDGNNGDWPGVALNGKALTIPTDAQFIITDGKEEGTQQTVDISQEGAKAYVRLLNTTDESGHYNVEWKEAAQDVPASEGYYIKGSASGWVYTAANKMSTEGLNEGDVAQFIGFTAKAEDQIRICSYYTDRAPFEQWADLQNGTSAVGTKVGDNLKFTADGVYDVYAKYIDDHFYFDVVAHAEPEPEASYTVKYNGLRDYELVKDEDEMPEEEGLVHQYSATIQYACRGNSLEFFKNEVKMTEGIGAPTGNNNIVSTESGFKIYRSYDGMKVYLKEYSDGGYAVWGENYAEPEFYIMGKAITIDQTFTPDETYIKQFASTSPISFTVLGTEEEKYQFTDNDGYATHMTVEAVAGNNAVQAGSTSFNVHNDCTANVYLKMKTDYSLALFIGGYEAAHVLTIGGKTVNLSNNGDGQYVAHGVALAAGDEVTSYTIEGAAQTVTSKKVANNNLGENKKVVADVGSADIYYNVEAKTLWVSGLPAAGQHILKNGHTVIEMTHTDPYEGYDQYASGLLTFAANDTFKVLNTGADDSYAVPWCPKIVATSDELKDKIIYDEANGQMKIVEACEAAVYLKIKSGVDEIYFGNVPQYVQDAVDFVNEFKSSMAANCTAIHKQDSVEAGWSICAANFKKLSEQAQAEVKKGESSLVKEIREFAERYIAIKQQHPDWNLKNFLEWDIPSSGRYAGVDLELSANNNMMAIIIAIAATSAIALTALLVIKKRKHH